MFPFVSFLRTLPLHLLHLEPTNGRVNVWRLVCISRELQRQCNPASQPNKTCCDEPSSYFPLTLSLSCSLSTLSLLLRLLLLKQTNRRISTDDVLLQAASFNGRSMAFARDPSLSTVHTSNYEIILVDVHATNKQLQTVQHARMRASLFSLANSANIRMCFIEPEIWNGRKAYSMATSLTRNAVFSGHSWGACPQRGIALSGYLQSGLLDGRQLCK